MDKIAIQVPNKYLSEAVQRYLFDKGYKWCGDKDAEVRLLEEKILYIEGMTIWHDAYAADTYTPLTVDEFFKREEVNKEEAKKKDLYISGYGKVKATSEGFTVEDGKGFNYIVIFWEEYDKIGKLRPKESK